MFLSIGRKKRELLNCGVDIYRVRYSTWSRIGESAMPAGRINKLFASDFQKPNGLELLTTVALYYVSTAIRYTYHT